VTEADRVILTEGEVIAAVQIGVARMLGSIKLKSPDAHGYDGEDGWTKHIEGAGAEMAAAKRIACYWSATVNTYKQADLRDNVQVRWRSRDYYDLIIRDDDPPDHIYILVLGKMPSYRVVGFIRGVPVDHPEWRKTYGNREEAWFVPQNALRPL
jgi:hypothetical protein